MPQHSLFFFTARPYITAQQQAGATLVSLMIGMLISIMSIVAVLALYKNLITVSINSSEDSSHDGQLTAAVLTSQFELQNAGYGIANADGLHINASADGSEIRWRTYDNAAFQCRAIKETSPANNIRELAIYEATNNCTQDSQLSTLNWTKVSTLTRVQKIEDINTPLVKFSVGSSTCSPFGIGETSKHMTATITVLSSVNYHSGDNGNEFTLCLASTHPA